MKTISAIIATLALGGCATYSGTVTTKDGQQVVCSASGPGIIGALVAQSSYQNCINQAQAQRSDNSPASQRSDNSPASQPSEQKN